MRIICIHQQLKMTINPPWCPNSFDVHNERLISKHIWIKLSKKQAIAMATLEMQVENKAQLANYEAMQCELLFAT